MLCLCCNHHISLYWLSEHINTSDGIPLTLQNYFIQAYVVLDTLPLLSLTLGTTLLCKAKEKLVSMQFVKLFFYNFLAM